MFSKTVLAIFHVLSLACRSACACYPGYDSVKVGLGVIGYHSLTGQEFVDDCDFLAPLWYILLGRP